MKAMFLNRIRWYVYDLFVLNILSLTVTQMSS